MKKFTPLLIVLISLGNFSIAQETLTEEERWQLLDDAFQKEACGTDQIELARRKANPDIIQFHQELEAFTQDWIANHKHEQPQATPDKSEWNATYIIPVVYHVIHQNGVEKLDKDDIDWDLRIINKIYNRDAPDTADVIAEFKHLITDISVEFRLAQKDPNGNATDGVDYIENATTTVGDESSKLNMWPRSKYLNIWTVADISNGAAAYSFFPGTVNTDSIGDGIIVKAEYVGTTRTNAHEIGHYLNVSHTWGISTQPGDPAGCNDDDLIDDTPNTVGYQSCDDLYAISCGDHDMVQNYMDYSGCTRIFTHGQRDRMHAVLNGTNTLNANRDYLWTTANLIATGVADPDVYIDELEEKLNFNVYPNPMNDVANITFSLNNPYEVNIRVMDVLGREVKQITNTTLYAGTHQIAFDKEGLNTGMYLIQMTVNGKENFTKRLIIE